MYVRSHHFSRSRACSVPPYFGKDQCVGDSTEVETCDNLPQCEEGKYLCFINISREPSINNDLIDKLIN